MTVGNANCAVCGQKLLYSEQGIMLTCSLCGAEKTGHCHCEAGHYVCDKCHRANGVGFILKMCNESASKNPIDLAQQIMNDKSIYPNGPEHHSLVGAVLLTAYKNAGGSLDLEAALSELQKRSLQVPGGTCGFWGCCGAAISAGQAYSIMAGSTPMKSEEWGATTRLTSRILARLADIGGPRCCKRTGFTAIEESVRYIGETLGVTMELPAKTQCTFMAGNAECLRRQCPYF